jgi:hypothetical protein
MARDYCMFLPYFDVLLVRSKLTLRALQTQAIDDAYRSVAACDEPEKIAEGRRIVEELGRLKYEVQHDRALTYVSPPPEMPSTYSVRNTM